MLKKVNNNHHHSYCFENDLTILQFTGETWREHTTSYLQTGWQGDDEEIYADFVATTHMKPAYEELDTCRVVRISCTGFPQYFAILSRIKEEVRAIGADGGKVTSSHEPHVQAYFPKGKEKNIFSVHQLISHTIILPRLLTQVLHEYV